MMKFITMLAFSISGICFSQMKTLDISDFEIQHKKNPKPIILRIYTKWCSVCKMDYFRINQDKELISLINKHLYFINFDAENTKEKIIFQGKEYNYLPNGNSGVHELAIAFSKNKNLPIYPLWIILDAEGTLVYYHEGFCAPEILKENLKNCYQIYSKNK